MVGGMARAVTSFLAGQFQLFRWLVSRQTPMPASCRQTVYLGWGWGNSFFYYFFFLCFGFNGSLFLPLRGLAEGMSLGDGADQVGYVPRYLFQNVRRCQRDLLRRRWPTALSATEHLTRPLPQREHCVRTSYVRCNGRRSQEPRSGRVRI